MMRGCEAIGLLSLRLRSVSFASIMDFSPCLVAEPVMSYSRLEITSHITS